MGNFQGRKLSRISLFCIYKQKFSPRSLECSVDSRQYEQAIHEKFTLQNPIIPRIRAKERVERVSE